MTAEIVTRTAEQLTIQVKIKLNGSMLEMENAVQTAVNQVGNLATGEAIKTFDATGAPIKIAGVNLTSKGKVKKEYQTPYGALMLERYVYQTSRGGATYCPLDERAKIITSSTPKLAQMLSYKYTSLSAREVAEDLELNHGRKTIPSFVQQTADMVGSIAQASEEAWDYDLPEQTEAIGSISTSLDGTCMLMREDGYREAMTGNISLYNLKGDRVHTIYLGAHPEYGKAKFLAHLDSELKKVKKKYPDVTYVGIADGAKTNWDFLEPRTSCHILDFYHATEYLAGASCSFANTKAGQKIWLDTACHKLKHEQNAAIELKSELEHKANEVNNKLSVEAKKKLAAALTYFTNQLSRMNYHEYLTRNLPIGSGVTEAACKTLIKQRLCRSGMRWKNKGAGIVIALRALVQTTGRWIQFWDKINQNGFADLKIS